MRDLSHSSCFQLSKCFEPDPISNNKTYIQWEICTLQSATREVAHLYIKGYKGIAVICVLAAHLLDRLASIQKVEGFESRLLRRVSTLGRIRLTIKLTEGLCQIPLYLTFLPISGTRFSRIWKRWA